MVNVGVSMTAVVMRLSNAPVHPLAQHSSPPPGLKSGTTLAGIDTGTPVLGLRRAARRAHAR